MKKNRYVEKDLLCKYDLSYEFISKLNIKIKDIVPLRKVFLLYTDKGNKILKNVDYGVERIEFIDDCLNYVKNKYENIITFNKFDDGKCYMAWKGNIYVVMDVIEGHECSFYNPIEVKMCSENIALLHNASKGIKEYLEKKYSKEVIDKPLIEKFEHAIKSLDEIKKIVSNYTYKNEFDTIFLNNVDKYNKEINECIDRLKNSNYLELRKENDKISLCHNDLIYHNFLINEDKINIIDFDYMTIDIRVIDVADFILKSIKNTAFDMNKMDIILNSYEKINKLSSEEISTLKILLAFPKDFYTIVSDYYNKGKAWNYEVFLNRFISKMDNEKFRYELINNLDGIVN